MPYDSTTSHHTAIDINIEVFPINIKEELSYDTFHEQRKLRDIEKEPSDETEPQSANEDLMVTAESNNGEDNVDVTSDGIRKYNFRTFSIFQNLT